MKNIINDIKKTLLNSNFQINLGDKERKQFFSGSPILDLFLGGGLPYIGTTYIWGGESVGKTTLSYQILSSFIKQFNTIPIIIDTEESYDNNRFKSFVKDDIDLIVVNLDYIEDLKGFLDKIYDKISNLNDDYNIFLIWDTISSTPSKEEYVNDMDKPASVARALSRIFRIIKLEKLKMTMLLISQYRETSITNPFATKEAPGGAAAKHKSDITLFLKAKKDDTIINPKAGRIVKILTQKSRFISPWQEMDFVVKTNSGWSSILTAIYYLVNKKVISKNRGKFIYNNNTLSIEDLFSILLSKEGVNLWVEIFNLIIEEFNEEDKEYLKDNVYNKIINYYFSDDKTIKERIIF